MWKRVDLGRDSQLPESFVPYPQLSTLHWRDFRASKTAYGSSGSDLFLIADKNGKWQSVKTVTSEEQVFRTVMPRYNTDHVRIPLTPQMDTPFSFLAGDRLPTGQIFCAMRNKTIHTNQETSATRVVVEAGSGETRVLADTTIPEKIEWFREGCAYGDYSIKLFDVGRGKIEIADTKEAVYGSSVGLVLQPKVVLIRGSLVTQMIDMNSKNVICTRKHGYSMNVSAFIAGCRSFFVQTGMPRNGFEVQQDEMGIYNLRGQVDAAFAWHPARGPLLMVEGYYHGRYRRTEIHVIDPRRFTRTEIPNSSMVTEGPRPSHSLVPTHVCGQPGITAISRNSGKPSFMIV